MSKWADKTRDGMPVRIYTEEAGGRYSIHGAVFREGRWWVHAWTEAGKFFADETSNGLDLIPAEPPEPPLPKIKVSTTSTRAFYDVPGQFAPHGLAAAIYQWLMEQPRAVRDALREAQATGDGE